MKEFDFEAVRFSDYSTFKIQSVAVVKPLNYANCFTDHQQVEHEALKGWEGSGGTATTWH